MQQEECNVNQSVIELDLLPHLDLNIDLQSIIEELSAPADEKSPESPSQSSIPDTAEDQQDFDEEFVETETDFEEEVSAETEPSKDLIEEEEEEEPDEDIIEEVITDVLPEQEQALSSSETPSVKESETVARPHPSAEMDEDEIKTEIRHLENLILGDPTAEGYIELAEFNILLKRYAHAERHLRSALELDKNNIGLKLQLADLALKQHNYARTVSCSLDIIHTEFDNYRAHTMLGLAFIRLNKRKKAEKALNMALRFNPACKEARGALTELKKQKRLF